MPFDDAEIMAGELRKGGEAKEGSGYCGGAVGCMEFLWRSRILRQRSTHANGRMCLRLRRGMLSRWEWGSPSSDSGMPAFDVDFGGGGYDLALVTNFLPRFNPEGVVARLS